METDDNAAPTRAAGELAGPGRPASTELSGMKARLHPSMASIAPSEWDALFVGSPENWAFYRAVEEAPPPGFTLGAVTVHAGDGRLLAAAPMFRLDYRIDTPFQGPLRAVTDWLNRRRPGLTSFAVIGLGSPMADNLSLGFAPGLPDAQRAAALEAMLGALQVEGDARRAAIFAVKSLAGEDSSLEAVLARHDYSRVTSVPVVMLPLPYADLDAFYRSIHRKDRSYLRRRFRAVDKLRVETRTTAAGIEDRLVALYEETLSQSGADYGDFDRLPPHLFERMLARMQEQAQLVLYWLGDDLIGFQIFLAAEQRLISYKIGMTYPLGREHNLFFVNWLIMMRHAFAHRIPEIEMGATTYGAKLLLGGYLERRWLHFRFRRGWLNRLSRPFHALFDFERNDPELKKLRAERDLPWGPQKKDDPA